MSKNKLTWLDKFAQEQAEKEMQKTASAEKVAQQIIVNPEDVPGAQEGATVQLNGEEFDVVNANYTDELGPGVVLQAKVAGLEQIIQPPAGSAFPSAKGQEYHRVDPGNVYQTYSNEEDAQWGQSSADATSQEIAGENAVDRTSVPGHYTKSPGLNSAPVPAVAVPAPSVADDAAAPVPVEEPTEDVEVKDEAPVKDVELDKEDVENKDEENVEDMDVKKANRIKSRMESKQASDEKVEDDVTELNSYILTLSDDVSDTIVAETEEILEDAEMALREIVPARFAKKALLSLEKGLENEGIESLFEKTVTREALKVTASNTMTEDELEEAVSKIVAAVVDEMEDVLKDADETMDKEKTASAKEDDCEFETKLKSMVERKLHAKGIYVRFARTASVKETTASKTIANKIRDTRNKKNNSSNTN